MHPPSLTQTSFARRMNNIVRGFDVIKSIKLYAVRHGCKDDEKAFFKHLKYFFYQSRQMLTLMKEFFCRWQRSDLM